MKLTIPAPIKIVHLQWDGPKTWEEKHKLNTKQDYGLYQIYGCHSVYGADCLLYIGKACNQTFATRLKQEAAWVEDADFGRLTIYVGRCSDWDGTPSDKEWCKQINLSEKLLILAHRPGWNAQKNINRHSKDLMRLHILNWGCHRNLLPEVSGLRYTSVFDGTEGDSYAPFCTP